MQASSLLILLLVFLLFISSLSIHGISLVNVVLACSFRVLHLNDEFFHFLLFRDKEVLVDDALGQALNLSGELASGCASKTIGPAVLRFDLLDDLLLVDACHGVHVVLDVSLWWVEVSAASLSHDMETIDLWLVMVYLWRQNDGLFVVLQEMVWETRAEEGSIDRHRPKLRNVNLVTPWAENLESGHLQAVAESDWEHLLSITEGSWAGAIEARKELVVNFCHSAS